MKKLTKEYITKLFETKKKEYRAKELKRAAEYKKKGWGEYTPREFSFSIPWKPRLGLFKYQARSRNVFDPSAFEATSYDHWTYLCLIKGRVVFNNYNYSVTTNAHQGDMQGLLSQLGIKVDIEVEQRSSVRTDDPSSIEDTLSNWFERIFELEVAIERVGSKPEANKDRKAAIRSIKADIKKVMALGTKISQTKINSLKREVVEAEQHRIERLKREAAERKAFRDRLKAISKADPSTLDSRLVEYETNSEVRKALVNRIGIARILKDLKAETLDKQGDYELVNLKLAAGIELRAWEREPDRPYLKMLNPSTGEVHVEGVPPHIKTVNAALAWRNGLDNGWNSEEVEFSKPIKLT